jgi:hypothetical protein
VVVVELSSSPELFFRNGGEIAVFLSKGGGAYCCDDG